MTATYIGPGGTIPHTPGSALAAGDVVVLGDENEGSYIGVAKEAIAANVAGVLHTEGVYEFPKSISAPINVGEAVFWDAGNTEASGVGYPHAQSLPAGMVPLGVAWETKAESATTIRVKINAGWGGISHA